MTILITADLHLDLWAHARRDPFTGIVPVRRDLDALIIAGDLTNDPQRNWPKALARIARLVSPARIWVIPGNHDYYGATLNDGVLARIAAASGVNLAQKRDLTFGSCRLLCCTLWTDFALLGDPGSAMDRAAMAMPDYARILGAEGGLICPEDTVAIHRDHLDWLTREIAKPWPGQTVIVTHHAPRAAVSGPISGISPAFASDLDGWIGAHQPDYWFFGHTHRPLSARIRGAPVVNVSLGTPDEVPEGGEAELLLRGLIFPGARPPFPIPSSPAGPPPADSPLMPGVLPVQPPLHRGPLLQRNRGPFRTCDPVHEASAQAALQEDPPRPSGPIR